jgi:hypothetical protein
VSPKNLIVRYSNPTAYPSLGTVVGQDGMARVYVAKEVVGGGLKINTTTLGVNDPEQSWTGTIGAVTLTKEQGLAFMLAIAQALSFMDDDGNQKEPA